MYILRSYPALQNQKLCSGAQQPVLNKPPGGANAGYSVRTLRALCQWGFTEPAWHHLGTCEKCRILGPSQCRLVSTFKFEEHCSKARTEHRLWRKGQMYQGRRESCRLGVRSGRRGFLENRGRPHRSGAKDRNVSLMQEELNPPVLKSHRGTDLSQVEMNCVGQSCLDQCKVRAWAWGSSGSCQIKAPTPLGWEAVQTPNPFQRQGTLIWL